MDQKKLPHCVTIQQLVRTRYDRSDLTSSSPLNQKSSDRPASWDLRIAGIDTVLTATGERLQLFSEGMQSPPKKGWKIILMNEVQLGTYSWTLYGIPRGAEVSNAAAEA